jgi:hypothetical protein
MRALSADDLLRDAQLEPAGQVTWGCRPTLDGPGVYVVESPLPRAAAPIDPHAIAAWIDRIPTLRLDGLRPSGEDLAARLGLFWIRDERVVYIGLAGTSVAKRVGQFYRTSLGDRGPHAGGHWLKTLSGLENFRVHWAETNDPAAAEEALLRAFAKRHGSGFLLPFANRQTADGRRKAHGITGSTITATTVPTRPATERRPTPSRSAASERIVRINAALQRLAASEPDGTIGAVPAARELDRLGLLKDSHQRPGLPLRNLLRDGHIENAYQENGRWWFIKSERH